MNRFTQLLLSAAVIWFFPVIARADISVVALTGQPAPGTNATFDSLYQTSVNSLGEIAFGAALSNGGTGIFKLSHGQLSAVALSGQSIAGSPGLTFGRSMSGPVINDSSTIVFSALLQGGTPNLQGLFTASGASINEILDTTTLIPGTSNNTISYIESVQLNNRGDIALDATLTGASNISLMQISNGTISVLGSMPPLSTSFSLNNMGDIAYVGTDSGIHLFSGGITQLIAQIGQPVPNTNVVLGPYLVGLAMNDQREIVFLTGWRGGLALSFRPSAIIKWQTGILEEIALDGDPVLGVPNSKLMASSIGTPVIDNSGRVFFAAAYYNPNSMGNDVAILVSNSGNLSVVVQQGQVLDGVGTFTSVNTPNINNSGTVTFWANVDTGANGLFQVHALLDNVYFPEVADGGYAGQWSWRTTLMLSNRDSSGPASISVSFFNDDGTPMNVGIHDTTGSQFSFTILASGSLQIETSGIGNEKTGWARVQSDKSVSGISIFSFYDGSGNYVAEMGAPATAAMTSFSMFIQSTTDINTGLAIANPNSSPAQVTLTLRDSQGNALGSPVSLTVPVNGHIQGYVTDLFPQGTIPTAFQGTLDVVSQVPVIGLNHRQRGGQTFTWLPLIQ